MTHSSAIRATGLTKRFGDMTAVDSVDLDIRTGECFGFLGPNGAGKTTTMRMMSCRALRDGGDMTVLGIDPHRDPRAVKALLGVVAQEINLDVELTVRENILVYGRYFDLPASDVARRCDELLDFVNLTERADWTVDRLSGGMQRRLQIARALVNEPQIVLLDEPTTGLDPQARHLVWDRLRELRARGVTLVVTTHYMDEAEQLCDRLVVMDHGRIVREGSPAELIAREVGGEVVELVSTLTAGELAARIGESVLGWTQRGSTVWLYGVDAEEIARRAQSLDPHAERRTLRRATLEDVFLQITGHALRDDL